MLHTAAATAEGGTTQQTVTLTMQPTTVDPTGLHPEAHRREQLHCLKPSQPLLVATPQGPVFRGVSARQHAFPPPRHFNHSTVEPGVAGCNTKDV